MNQQDKMPPKATVVMKIPREEKGAWVRQSRKEGKKLVEWIRERCRVK